MYLIVFTNLDKMFNTFFYDFNRLGYTFTTKNMLVITELNPCRGKWGLAPGIEFFLVYLFFTS